MASAATCASGSIAAQLHAGIRQHGLGENSLLLPHSLRDGGAPHGIEHWKHIVSRDGLLQCFQFGGNTLNVCGMAFGRYFDNKHRAAYRRRCRSSFAIIIIFVISCLAFLVSFPVIYGGKVQKILCTNAVHVSSLFLRRGNRDIVRLTSVTTAFCLTNIIYIKLFLLLRGRRRMRPVIYEPAVSENWGFYNPKLESM
ncbi:putative G protein-coupled receptor 85 [Caerostris extrusa]|uniref:G protein-coupled receptor 85 n=1 Tax=Caerostris extrusa TaxID=172846 RepID=A0AAV4WN29_CAEEX|nr:putative G protein-coupled receptor 85 [Caerostris extrusa]